MRIIDEHIGTDCCQCPVGSIKQRVGRCVVDWSEPFSLEHSPKSLGNVKVWRIWREVEQEKTSLFPYWTKFLYNCIAVNACIVKDYKSILTYLEGEFVQIVSDLFCGNAFSCGEPVITVIPADHSKDVEPGNFLRRNINVFSLKLPSVRHVPLSTDVAFVCIIDVNTAFLGLVFKFLQLLGLIRIELRRGLPLGTFSYTSISCANADKKSLNVLCDAFLPEACSHAALALATLCLSFSIAFLTASSSEQSIIGLRPRPGRVSRPLIPSASKRLTQELTVIKVISVCSPICFDVSPCDFRRTARQRIRYAWLLPLRKPSSNCRRCLSVSCITLIFAIVVCLYVFTQRYAKILI